MKVAIHASRNYENTNTLLHPLVVWINDGIARARRCSTYDLVNYLRTAGVSKDEIDRLQSGILEEGRAVLESSKIVDADVERVLEPEEDLFQGFTPRGTAEVRRKLSWSGLSYRCAFERGDARSGGLPFLERASPIFPASFSLLSSNTVPTPTTP
jgi:hypothetical protein